MLLFTYTPRPPSLSTERMLQFAYRVGLRGARLEDHWQRCAGKNQDGITRGHVGDTFCSEETTFTRTSRPKSEHVSAEEIQPEPPRKEQSITRHADISGGHGNYAHRKNASNHHSLQIRAFDFRNYLNVNPDGDGRTSASSTDTGGDATESIEAPDQTGSRSERMNGKSHKIEPVLLAFRMSPATSRRQEEDDIRPQDCRGNSCSVCTDELQQQQQQQWMSEWRYMFPDVHFKTSFNGATSLPEKSRISSNDRGCAQVGIQNLDTNERYGVDGACTANNDECTWEELWATSG